MSVPPHLRCLCPPSDSKAIVDGNLKLILGLIWTLILHYSISMPTWEGEDEEVRISSALLGNALKSRGSVKSSLKPSP